MRHLIQIVDASKGSMGRIGSRTHCGKPARKEAHFDEGKAMIIEKYCDVCSAPENFDRLQEWYTQVDRVL